MSLDLHGTEELTKAAVAHYWTTLETQAARQQGRPDSDRGARSAVTGGKQMDGFCRLIQELLLNNGLQDGHIHLASKLELPGYFRPTKNWDMLVIHEGILLASMEFKSQKGPSFGNNFNNRAEEAIGTGHDLATAYREGALGKHHPRPWTGWVMLLEDCAASTSPVAVSESHFPVFPEFKGASYAARYELLLRKLVTEKLYDASALLLATASGGPRGEFGEPAADLTMRKFLASLGGHVAGYLAGR